jgi:hypothetical protein
MEQFENCYVDFHEIWNLRVLRKFVERRQLSLASDIFIVDFVWRQVRFSARISLNTYRRNISIKSYREKCNMFYVHYIFS